MQNRSFTDQNSPLFRYDALNPKRNNGDDDQSNRIGIRREGAVDVLTAIVIGVGGIVVGHYRMECLVIVSLSLSLFIYLSQWPSIDVIMMHLLLCCLTFLALFWHLIGILLRGKKESLSCSYCELSRWNK